MAKEGWVDDAWEKGRNTVSYIGPYSIHQRTGYCITGPVMPPKWMHELKPYWLVWKPGKSWRENAQFDTLEEAQKFVEEKP